MKKKIFKRGMAGLLAVLTAFTTLIGMGTTAFAASETAESYMVSYPRDGDAVQVYDHSTWGHDAKTHMNGWSTGASNMTTIHCMDSYDGKVCYCIEPGVPRNVGDSYSGFGENFWDNYPSQYNKTIEPDDIKVLLGRIMQYGYQGNISTSWKSQNDADADKMAHAIATQLLVWETVIGERDADFNHVSTGGKDTVKSVIGSGHPLKSRIDSYYSSIVSSVQSHVEYPSFMSKSTGKATTIELEWDGSKYVAELTDTNNVLSKFTFSASATGFNFSVSGNKLTITTDNAPTGDVTITASRSVARCGVLVWTDNKYGPDGGIQDTVTYTASVSDPVKAFIKLKVSYGSAKIIKTSEDGKVDGIKFTVVGDGVNQTVTTNSKGEIQIDNLMSAANTANKQKRHHGTKENRDLWGSKLQCSCGHSFRKNRWHKNNNMPWSYGYQCYNQLNNGSAASRRKAGVDDTGYCDQPMIADWKLDLMAKFIFERIWIDACYCFGWHECMRNVFCGTASALTVREQHENLELPKGAKLLRDIDNHDTVTDWLGRTETVCGHNGMEQIEVINYLIDGIPMVYAGNELACEAELSMFANRFFPGSFGVTNRNDKYSEKSKRRQQIIMFLNKIKAEKDLLHLGKTIWIENSMPDIVLSFKRALADEEILFVGNTKNTVVDVDIPIPEDKKCI